MAAGKERRREGVSSSDTSLHGISSDGNTAEGGVVMALSGRHGSVTLDGGAVGSSTRHGGRQQRRRSRSAKTRDPATTGGGRARRRWNSGCSKTRIIVAPRPRPKCTSPGTTSTVKGSAGAASAVRDFGYDECGGGDARGITPGDKKRTRATTAVQSPEPKWESKATQTDIKATQSNPQADTMLTPEHVRRRLTKMRQQRERRRVGRRYTRGATPRLSGYGTSFSAPPTSCLGCDRKLREKSQSS